ncbi:hypothetical protein M0R45_015947 [Rubus argutus]|uniref:Bifunctional inhibitor/plant lipid transfer protein/seed storage helical domain-containing protein n=1 Tax=Rubus argutus TaxID=59490 RepID=A0AAW1XS17_RUBAR
MASSGVLKVVCAMVLFMAALFLSGAKASIPCRILGDDLQPCIPYLAYGSVPSEECCNGLKSVYDKDHTTRVDIANCLTKLQREASLGSYHFALGLPDKCGLVG